MPYNFTKNNSFDTQDYVASLIKDLGLENAEPAKKEKLRQMIEKQMTNLILRTASLALEPDVVDEVIEEHGEETDPVWFIRKLIEESPAAQSDIVQALDEFYDQTLNALKVLKS